jgi:hypothetical protein
VVVWLHETVAEDTLQGSNLLQHLKVLAVSRLGT